MRLFRIRLDDFSVTKKEVSEFIEEVKEVYPDPRLSLKNFVYAFGGYRPVDSRAMRPDQKGVALGSATVARSSSLLNLASAGAAIGNAVHITAPKYTTFLREAAKAADLISELCCLRSADQITSGEINKGHEYGESYLETELEERIEMAMDDRDVFHLEDLVIRRAHALCSELPSEEMIGDWAKRLSLRRGWEIARLESEVRMLKSYLTSVNPYANFEAAATTNF